MLFDLEALAPLVFSSWELERAAQGRAPAPAGLVSADKPFLRSFDLRPLALQVCLDRLYMGRIDRVIILLHLPINLIAIMLNSDHRFVILINYD